MKNPISCSNQDFGFKGTLAASPETVLSVQEFIREYRARYAKMGLYEIPYAQIVIKDQFHIRINTPGLLLQKLGVECPLGHWRCVRSRSLDNFLVRNERDYAADATTQITETLAIARLDLFARFVYMIDIDILVKQECSVVERITETFVSTVKREHSEEFLRVLGKFFAANHVKMGSTLMTHAIPAATGGVQ